MARLLRFLSLLWLAGCMNIEAEVESDTSWSGAFGDRTVDGSGNATVDLVNEHPQCIVVQKDTRAGRLRARVHVGGGFLTAVSGSEWVETTADFGVVTACSE